MINKVVPIEEIQYDTVPCDALLDSIRKRGIAIAVHVKQVDENHYLCVDGNVRLSACAILAKEDEKYKRIPVMVINDFSKAGSGYWGNSKNHH